MGRRYLQAALTTLGPQNPATMTKRYPIFLLGLWASSVLMAQTAFDRLDINNVDARFSATGLIGMDPENAASASYFVPRATDQSGPAPLYAAGLWIGGLTPDNVLKFAGELYPTSTHDFFPGPLGTNGQVSQATATVFNHVWKVDRADVVQHLAYFACLAGPDCNAEVEYPSYTIPQAFFEWPAHGNVDEGQAYLLADFIDFDGDGYYDPNMGDAPCIPGDQALFCIYNDMLDTHTASGGLPIGVEVQMTPFAFASSDPAINNTIFVRYRIFNRGTQSLQQTLIGIFADFDLGCPYDDYLQCDVGRSLFYVLNGDDVDEDCQVTGYGAQPPAFGIAVIKGPLMDPDGSDNTDVGTLPGYNGTGFGDGIADNERYGLGHFMYSQGSDLTGLPSSPAQFYQYLRSIWKDGTPLTYSGDGYSQEADAVTARFAFPGDSDPLGVGTNGEVMAPWTEASAGNQPWDRRAVASMGPFSFDPGDMQEIILAFVYARAESGGPEASAEALRLTTDTVRAFAATIPGLMDPGPGCYGIHVTGINDLAHTRPAVSVRPNPAHDRMELVLPEAQGKMHVLVWDATGQLVMEHRVHGDRSFLDVSTLDPGIYMVQARDGQTNHVVRFVKD